MTYRIEFRPSARKALLGLPKKVRDRVDRKLALLSQTPRPRGCEPLSGTLAGYLRVRLGDYRVIYRVDDDVLLVLVLSVGHRSRVYQETGRHQ